MDLTQLPLILTALGGGAIIPSLIKGVRFTFTGRGKKRRDEVDQAWRRVDREADRRRVWQDYAWQLRRILREAPCVEAASIPPSPAYSSTDTSSTQKEIS